MATALHQFTSDDCKDALNDILDALNKEENASRLDEARESAGNDMLKAMQLVFPLATQIEMGVIDKYGFVGNGEGLIRFAQSVRSYEKHDPEIAQLNEKLRAIMIPLLHLQPPVNALPVEETVSAT